jgi:hypothetical protein
MAEPDDNQQQDADLDVGPLTVEQLRGMARDVLLQLRRVADELNEHKVRSEAWLIDRLEFQLCEASGANGG